MANQVHIGRVSLTSPSQLGFEGSGGNRTLNISGKLAETNLETAKYIRDELVSMAQSGYYVPFEYDGDSSFNGFVEVSSSNIDISRYSIGGINYSVDMKYLGKVGEVVKESVITGKLLDNDHGITSTTQQFHTPPANHYNYYHTSNPESNVRVAADLTTTNTQDSVNLYFKTSQNLRTENAQFHVNTSDFYKGAVKITTNNLTRNGLNSPNNPGNSVIENGIMRIVIGNQPTQSRFTTYIWDQSAYQSDYEYSIHRGTPTSGQQLSTEFRGWNTIQVLRNLPELGIIRLTSNYEADGQGRLTVDISLRRGAHHASVIINQSPAVSRLNLGLSSATAMTSSTGYLKKTSLDVDGNKVIFGSPSTFSSDTTRGLIYPSAAGTQFKAFVGYEFYNQDGTLSTHNESDNVRDQYLDNVSEYCRVIKG
jgi:hypothetical protein|tara:strand:- start:1325 stop:2593 length:1269 start_codon:yes stop_codon:yes gene_type:complete